MLKEIHEKKRASVLIILVIMSFWTTLSLAAEVEITICHTNDTHGRIEEDQFSGMGFAKLSTLIERERARNSNLVLLDAGDTFHGQPPANLTEGESVCKILNIMGYDAVVPGNHDFTYGQEQLLELNRLTNFPILAANIQQKNNAPYLNAYRLLEMDGVRIAVFGLATPETRYKTHPRNVEGLVFADPVEAARTMVNELKDKTDILIALSHLGMTPGSRYTSQNVAERVPGIDLIVDGHSHDVLPDGKLIGSTLIVSAGEYGKQLGVVRITLENGEVISRRAGLIYKEETHNLSSNPEVLKVIDEIKKEIIKITSIVVGKTNAPLDGEREHIRTGETNLGNLITDVMVEEVGADLAFIHSGGIRSSIDKGDITKKEIVRALPFGNYVVVKDLKGEVILDMIEHGISAYPAAEGRFPQISGMSFLFDPALPPGERVIQLKIQGKTIDYDKTYRIAINDFLAAGGDGYTMLEQGKVVQEAGGLAEILIEFLKRESVVEPVIEGRITSVNKKGDNYAYRIKRGDTLGEIAGRFSVDLEELINKNAIKDINLIIAGEELLIPLRDQHIIQ